MSIVVGSDRVLPGLPVEPAFKLPEAPAQEPENQFRTLLEALPAAVYTTDTSGRITFYNLAAAELWGRTPELGTDEWCGTWRLYWPDGTPMPHDQCPMAIALKERRPVRDMEILAERPDGARVPVMPFPTPLYDAAGKFVGAVNMLVDIAELRLTKESVIRRVDEQAALYRFTDRLYRAESLTDVYDAALEAILGALRCSRASILLFDDAGVMRFVAWRGLSESYRRAVEGHSPWKPKDKDPHPICVDNIDTADELGALKATVKAEGIGALAFVPLVANGFVIGKFMTYHDAPHAFSDAEVELSVTIARQLGFSIERKRADEARRSAEESLRRSEERLHAIFNSAAIGAAILTPGQQFIRANGAFCAIAGYSEKELQALDCAALTHPDDRSGMQDSIDDLLAGRAANFVIEKRYLRKDGAPIWVQNSVSLTRDHMEQPLHLVVLSQDITERKHAEERQKLLLNELNHRVKNTLATVQSMASQTLRGKGIDVNVRESFESRLVALANGHDVLTQESWESADLRQVVATALAPFRAAGDGRLHADGPAVYLSPKAALALTMGLHELATNATKYGALSSETGTVNLSWVVDSSGKGSRLRLRWRESGGPLVAAPKRKGFGSRLIERGLSGELGGEVRLEYARSGVVCTIEAPLSL